MYCIIPPWPGTDTIANYQEVLREIHYSHNRPENINSRQFIVNCDELNGRFVSNDLIIQVRGAGQKGVWKFKWNMNLIQKYWNLLYYSGKL